jgi:hypothetical protein
MIKDYEKPHQKLTSRAQRLTSDSSGDNRVASFNTKSKVRSNCSKSSALAFGAETGNLTLKQKTSG